MAMAMQSGIGLSKIIFVAATGYTGTLLLKNGKLSELIGELQVHCLVNDFRALVPNRPIPIVVNDGNSLVVSAAALGVAGYGYIWWKGLSFSDIMFLTKHNMEKAVADLTTKLQHASDVIADAKKHLTQRLKNVADKVDKQAEISKKIHDDVNKVGNTVNGIHGELGNVREQLEKLRERTNKLLENQDYANEGLDLLINFIRTNCTRARDCFQGSILPEQPKLPGRSPAMLTYPGNQGLKVIVESLYSLDRSASDTIMPGGLDKLEQQQSPLLRDTSIQC